MATPSNPVIPVLQGTNLRFIHHDDVGITPINDVSGGAGTTTYFVIDVDASLNPGEDAFVRIFRSAAPDPAALDAAMVFKSRAGRRTTYVCPQGLTVATDTSFLACQDKGGDQASLSAPSGRVDVRMIIGD